MINKKVVIVIFGVILTIATIQYFFGGSANIGIIGSPDGPTAIAVTRTPVSGFPVFPLVAAVALVLVLFVRKRNEG